MKIVFGSVVYKSAEKYLPDFLGSLEKQKHASFSVLLLNDNIDIYQLEKIILQYSLNIEIVNCRERTPIELRIELLKQAKMRQVDLLILGDCDDYFSDTRVYQTINEYQKNCESTFFYNDIVDACGKNLMPQLPDHVSDFEQIGEYNFLGLSNTAVNMKKLDYTFINSLNEYHNDIFDWYFYSRILLMGLHGKKVDGCNTFYRIHENNVAGIGEYNDTNVKREVEIKRQHYKYLAHYNEYYLEKLQHYQNESILELNKKDNFYFWWNLTK